MRDHRGDIGGRDQAVDLVPCAPSKRVDLLVGGLLRIGVGDVLDERDGAVGFADSLLDRLHAKLGVGIDERPARWTILPLPPIALISAFVPT